MKVDGMFAGRQILKIEFHPDSGPDSHRIAVPTTLP